MCKVALKGLIVSLMILVAGCQQNMASAMAENGPIYNPAPSTAPTLAQAVQNALMQSGDPIIEQVHVESVEHKVILKGYVKKIRQSDTAEQLAYKVPGVQSVENNLIVRQ